MSKTIVTVMPEITPAQKHRITAAVKPYGYTAMFCDTAEEAMAKAEEAEIVLGFSPELLPQAKQMKWCCTTSAGVDRFIDPSLYSSRDVILTSSSGAYGLTISEHVVMMILEVFRRQQEYQQIIRERSWVRGLPMRSIYNSRITLLGTGNIGQECARRLKAFSPWTMTGINSTGMNPDDSLFDRCVHISTLPSILKETDILILSLPKTKDTFQILNEAMLKELPEGALIVNVGRGTCIDQKALETQLNEKRLYAALDVYENEPLQSDDSIWNCDHLLMTPHVAGDLSLPATVDLVVDLFLENFECYVSGQPMKRVIDFTKGY